MISEAAARRAHQWVEEAVADGGKIPRRRTARRLHARPDLVHRRLPYARVNRDEVFAPVLTITQVDNEQQAFAAVNDSAFGVHAGVFTHDLAVAFRALKVGGVPAVRASGSPWKTTYDRSLVFTGIDL